MATPTRPENERVRGVRLRASGATMERRDDGAILVRPDESLCSYPKVLTDRLMHWAAATPEQICAAKRTASGAWQKLTYAQMLQAVLRVAQSLLDRRLSSQRPVLIISDNDLEHLILMLAGQHVGIPTAHLSPSYSLASRDFAKLRHAAGLLNPGLVFAADGCRYSRAIEAIWNNSLELVVAANPPASIAATLFDELLSTSSTSAVTTSHEAIDPSSTAKILFTSGSTSHPKGVINTHRMICSNQQMIAQVFPFLQDEPPVLVDWLPWNHTFGGNHNVGIVIYNGGTLYIDDGKPSPALFGETLRNLREISTTVFFNVPQGYEDLLPHLRADAKLRETFFRRLRLFFYAGAGLSQPVWDAYRQLAVETCGERLIMVTGLGSTETAPMAIQTTWETDEAGVIGIPIPGVELKLVPRSGKLEACVRGPNITPGYWKQPELSAKAFDAEGFYKFGDAVRFVDPGDVNKGFLFDGRFSEDFKLASGTWVSVGPLRARILAQLAPFVRDVVIAGHNRNAVGILIFADVDRCAALCADLASGAASKEILTRPTVRARFQSLLEAHAMESTGSSNFVARAILVEDPPSLDAGEVTDKGSLNQNKVLQCRSALVEELYAEPISHRILCVTRNGS